MAGAEILVFLLVAVALLAGLGLRWRVPYPVVLVVGGLVLGLVPGLPAPDLDPDVVFFAFLPPLLYAAAFQASAAELRAHAAPIGLLAIGLVLVTVVGVAAVAHWAAGLSWVAAFVLGAVLGPTDPVSATAIVRRLGVSTRIETILEGEALVNDGTGLTAYKIALAAAGASLSAGEVVGKFVLVAVAGIAIGLAVGWLLAHARIATRDASIDVVLSVLTPFAAYVPAEKLGVSGVLAVVTAGVYTGTRALELAEAGARLRTLAFWQASEFLLNSLLFLLIGLQVTHIVGDITGSALGSLIGEGLLVAAAAIAVRFAWMFVVPQLADLSVIGHSYTNVRERVVLAWSGMRGGVSLAAALAIPADKLSGQREHVIFLAYVAVVVTLVLPGLTLAPLIERLGIGQTEKRRRQEVEARLRLTHAALERLEELAEKGEHDGAVDLLRDRYRARLDRLQDRLDQGGGHPQHGVAGAKAQLAALEHEREVLQDMRRERAFPTELLRTLESEIDVDEARTRSRGR